MVKGNLDSLTEGLLYSSLADPVLPRHCCQTLWGWGGDGNRLATPRAREAVSCSHSFTGRLCCGQQQLSPTLPWAGWMSLAACWISDVGL